MKLARVLLLLYPRHLRRLHGEEIELFLEACLSRLRERGGTGPKAEGGVKRGLAALVLHTVWDALKTRLSGPGWEGGTVNDEHRYGRETMGGWMQDFGYAARLLVRTPVFTLGAVLIVAVAIGANSGMFALVHAALLEPPPYDEPDRVVHVYQDSDDGAPSSSSYPAYLDMARASEVFASVGATSPDRASLTEGDGAQTVSVEYATSTLLPTLGMTPSVGRWFDPSMDRVGTGFYAVVSHPTWQRRYGGDPGIIGRTVELNGQPVEILGVGPRDYNGIFRFGLTDFWLSVSTTPVGGDFRVANLDRRQDHWYDVRARLAEGVTPARAQEAMDALALRLAEAFPDVNEGRGITVFPSTEVRVHPGEDARIRTTGVALMGVVVLVLMLAATNLGSLLLIRGAARGPEIAVRRALGAGDRRVVGLFVSEGLLLSLVGGVLGLGLAAWFVSALPSLPIPAPGGGTIQVGLSGPVLLFGVGLMVLTGIFFGWAPALQALRGDFAGALREQVAVTGRRRGSLFRDGMVAVQVAASVVLVVGASLFVRGLAGYQSLDPGVDVDRLAFVSTSFSEGGVGPEARTPVVSALGDRFLALPGVEAVEMTTRLPVSGGGSTTTVVEGYQPPTGTGAVELPFALVTPGYFAAVGMEVIAGRGYTVDDRIAPRQSVIVNETAARRFWGGAESAVGGRVRPQATPDAWLPVVGVISDATVGDLGSPPLPMLYFAMPTEAVDAPFFVLRATSDPSGLLGGVRAALAEVDPSLPVVRLETMADQLAASLAGPRLAAVVLSLFSLLALLLASVGIYAIVSLTVTARRPEIGLRMALGAARGRVVRMVMARVTGTLAVGVVLGGVVVAIVAPLAAGLTLGVSPLDPGALFLAAAAFSLTVTAACYLPARRATRVDPVDALRGP